VLLPDWSSREKFRSFSGQEHALHWSHRSLDRFNRLRRVLAVLQVVCNLFGHQGLLVCWLGVIFNVNILFVDSAGESEATQELIY